MNKFIVTIAFFLSSCYDPLCGATEQPQRMSVRHFVEEESFEKRCVASGPIELFSVNLPPTQDGLADVLSQAPFERFDVGDHPIQPGAYVQCTALEDGQHGGLCSGFILGADDGVIVMRHIIAPDFAENYTSQDTIRYTAVGPVAR